MKMKKIKAKISFSKVVHGKKILIELNSHIDYLGSVESLLKKLRYNIKNEKIIDFMPDGIYWYIKKEKSKDEVLVSYLNKKLFVDFCLFSKEDKKILELCKEYFDYRVQR